MLRRAWGLTTGTYHSPCRPLACRGGLRLRRLCVVGAASPTAHCTWQRQQAQQPLLLLQDGTLLEVQLQQAERVGEGGERFRCFSSRSGSSVARVCRGGGGDVAVIPAVILPLIKRAVCVHLLLQVVQLWKAPAGSLPGRLQGVLRVQSAPQPRTGACHRRFPLPCPLCDLT